MRRRECITLAGGAALTLCLSARAERAAMPVIGLLTVANLPDWATDGVRVGLAEADAAECMRLQSSWVRLRFHLAATSGAE